MLFTLLTILQDATSSPIDPGPTSAPGSFLSNPLLPLLVVGVLFFFLMILPERKKQRARQSMLDSLKKGDRVMTTSGIYGTVVTTSSEVVVLQVADNVRLRFSRAAVQSVVEPEKETAVDEKAEPSKA